MAGSSRQGRDDKQWEVHSNAADAGSNVNCGASEATGHGTVEHGCKAVQYELANDSDDEVGQFNLFRDRECRV